MRAALFCWHENRFFSQANGPIATKLAHDGHQVNLYPGCAQGQGQGQRSRDTRTFLDSWNELLRHCRSGFTIKVITQTVTVLMCEKVSFNCSCVPGYIGVYCEEFLDLCNGSDCRHGATCIPVYDSSSYVCQCSPGQSFAHIHSFIHSFISGMHQYECIAPNVDIDLQSGRF